MLVERRRISGYGSVPMSPPEKELKRMAPCAEDQFSKKKLKKQQRLKELEAERETEKNKWLAFTTKSAKKSGSAGIPKSIFASPDNVNGRVGIGTCGVAGKPMTETKTCEKWRKGI
ncbi:survival of motor neuron-related-splicing factor 30-like [Phlebotomus papatasi]|uniref:survival of motor neuron-related-splicing factor 30-like n=1 Tax=Phlebotomus papatasi TaxID=29031 RepID=UPI0024843449|nr:survival of motor neuron-related-splicing factor 30-like [Phlebotomus papatasi]